MSTLELFEHMLSHSDEGPEDLWINTEYLFDLVHLHNDDADENAEIIASILYIEKPTKEKLPLKFTMCAAHNLQTHLLSSGVEMSDGSTDMLWEALVKGFEPAIEGMKFRRKKKKPMLHLDFHKLGASKLGYSGTELEEFVSDRGQALRIGAFDVYPVSQIDKRLKNGFFLDLSPLFS